MAIESSKDPVGPARRSPIWDQPDGLGWEVWRRAQSTPISAQAMQRSLARSRRNFLKDPVPLASEFRARWTSSGYIAAARFGGDLPLFSGHFPINHRSSWPQNSLAWPGFHLHAENHSVSAAAPAVSRLPTTLPGSSVSASGSDAVAPKTVLPSQRADGSDGSHAGSLTTYSGAASRPTIQERRGEVVSVAAIATTVSGTSVPARVPMISPLAIPLSRGILGRISTPGTSREPIQTLRRTPTFTAAWKESALHFATSHPTFHTPPLLIAPATIIGSATQSQSSTISTANRRDNEFINGPEVGEPTPNLSIGGLEQRIISRSVLAAPKAATSSKADGLSPAKPEVVASSVLRGTSAFGSDAVRGSVPLSGSEAIDRVMGQAVAGSSGETGQMPITTMRSTTLNQASQLHPDVIGKRIFSFVKGMTISRLSHPDFGSGSRNAPLERDLISRAALRAQIALVPVVVGSSLFTAVPEANPQRYSPLKADGSPVVTINKFEPLSALKRSSYHPGAGKVQSAATQTIQGVNAASGAIQTSVNNQIVEKFGISGAKVSRAMTDGPSSSGPVGRRAGEGGMAIAVFSGGDFLSAQTHGAAAKNDVVYPLLSRTVKESSFGSSGSTGALRTVSSSSVYDDGYGIRLGDIDGPSGFDARVLRNFMSRAEFSGNHDSAIGSSPRISLPLIQSSLLTRIVSRASGLGQRDSARVARSSVIRSRVVGDSLLDTARQRQGMQSIGGVSTGMLPQATAETFSAYPSQPAELTPVFLSTRSTAEMGAPSLQLSFVNPASFEGYFGSAGTRERSYDMPLAMRSVAAGERASSFVQPATVPSLQTMRLETVSPASQALPISGAGVSANVGVVPAAGVQPKIDLDEIVEKAWQKLMRKLTIEQERRGYTRWL